MFPNSEPPSTYIYGSFINFPKLRQWNGQERWHFLHLQYARDQGPNTQILWLFLYGNPECVSSTVLRAGCSSRGLCYQPKVFLWQRANPHLSEPKGSQIHLCPVPPCPTSPRPSYASLCARLSKNLLLFPGVFFPFLFTWLTPVHPVALSCHSLGKSSWPPPNKRPRLTLHSHLSPLLWLQVFPSQNMSSKGKWWIIIFLWFVSVRQWILGRE